MLAQSMPAGEAVAEHNDVAIFTSKGPQALCPYRIGRALLSGGAPSRLLASLEAGLGVHAGDLCADVKRFLQRAAAAVCASEANLGRVLVALRVGADVAEGQPSLVVAATAVASEQAAGAVRLVIEHIKRLYA